MDHFWLTDEQFAKIAPHLPTDTRGKERVDDQRVISGIVHPLFAPRVGREVRCDLRKLLVRQPKMIHPLLHREP
ncbi:hypothetical protein MMMDOFMJ_4151 [Methylobacterium gnaphalii]|nr:hypothetical protein MMMDOFMJ_4151 [Methylobacterium gnaphalii]